MFSYKWPLPSNRNYCCVFHRFTLTLSTDIAAYPDSVNQLPGVLGDIRTPDKLIDGVRGTEEAGHQWLAPILPGVINNVYVIFNEPWSVSQIRLYNYGKTPSRGVREIAVSIQCNFCQANSYTCLFLPTCYTIGNQKLPFFYRTRNIYAFSRICTGYCMHILLPVRRS